MRPSSNAQTDKVLTQINEKTRQLKEGIAHDDQKLLKTRLQITWKEAEEVQFTGATAWRKSRARETYTRIQDVSEHFFLAAILVITPTHCTKKSFNNIVDGLLRIENYDPFYLNLSPTDKKFFETTAIEQGFSGNSGYLRFMRALFPQS
ncbi:hypothetical protein CC86DRAFT_169389 [Ophiobolus disseminans]|uniref:Uncharacterized protein n=1 Tax=Ophiobolus disseminans TaxID=1469910 RepID=A0A6A6ZC18_9PLEO|nr:hypothetical protein CC86DRAFT_169389 [Ophiobolus disseminans]